MKDMQRLATKVFITASVLFGAVGISIMLFTGQDEQPIVWLGKTLSILGFIVLSSFGVSVGLKYLNGK